MISCTVIGCRLVAKLVCTGHAACREVAGAHYGTEGSYVKVFLQHEFFSLLDYRFVVAVFLGVAELGIGLLAFSVQEGIVLDIDIEAFFARVAQEDLVTDFAVQALVGDDTVFGVRVDTRLVFVVRITVRVAVFSFDEYEIVMFFNGHCVGLLCCQKMYCWFFLSACIMI